MAVEKTSKPNLGFFILCNLIKQPHIHQFHLYFHMVFFSFAHWRFVVSKMGAYRVWDVFRVLLGRTFVFGLHTKNLKTFKKLKNLIF